MTVVLEFVSTMVSTEVPLGAITAGAKDLVVVGAPMTESPLAVTPLLMRAVAPILAAVLLYGPPTTFEVTSTVTAHEAWAAPMEAPVTVIVPLPAAPVTAPAPDGQVVVMFGAAATSTLAGSVSVKVIPDCAGVPAPLAIVKVSVLVPPAPMVAGLNALVSDACTTAGVSVVPPLAGAPARDSVPAAVRVGAPRQPFTTFGVAAITRPAGSVSLKVSPVLAGAPAGLAMVKVSVELCPMPTVAGAKAFVSDARPTTVRPEEPTLLVTRAVALMLAPVLLYGPPTTFEVTSTVTMHEACAALIEAPVTVIVPLPAAEPTAPAPDGQVVVTFGAAATSTLAGSVSVKLIPDCAGLPAPLVSVNVSVDVPP